LPKIQLPISEKEYKDAGSKFITIPAGPSGKQEVGDTVALLIECGLPDWDTPGRSIKFPVKVIQKGIDAGKADKISCGVGADGVWKLKEVANGFGKADAVTFENGKPNLDADAFVGAKAKGIWERQMSDPAATGKPATFYSKLVAIVSETPETLI